MTTMYDKYGNEIYIDYYGEGRGPDGNIYKPSSVYNFETRGTLGEKLYNDRSLAPYYQSPNFTYSDAQLKAMVEREEREKKERDEAIEFLDKSLKKAGTVAAFPFTLPFKLSKFVLEKAWGPRPVNNIAAGLLTAGFLFSVMTITNGDRAAQVRPTSNDDPVSDALRQNTDHAAIVASGVESSPPLSRDFMIVTAPSNLKNKQGQARQGGLVAAGSCVVPAITAWDAHQGNDRFVTAWQKDGNGFNISGYIGSGNLAWAPETMTLSGCVATLR